MRERRRGRECRRVLLGSGDWERSQRLESSVQRPHDARGAGRLVMLGALVPGFRGRNAIPMETFTGAAEEPPARLVAHLGQRREHHHELHDRQERGGDAARP